MDVVNMDNIDMMIDIRDFIHAHYLMCNREDTAFWRDVKTKSFIPDTLMQKLQVMSSRPPEQLFSGRIFAATNWVQWLWGTGFYKNMDYKIDEKYKDICEIKMDLIKTESEKLSKILPNHYEYLKNLYGRD
jgi:tryptophan halogenase